MTTADQTPTLPVPLLLLRLRAVVLALGESVTPAWWRTEFMNETGLRFLERLFPRTTFHAAVHAAGKAASEAHDRAVGRVGVYHLFKLPEPLEIELRRMPTDPADDYFYTLRNALGRPEELIKLLALICDGEEADCAPGAQNIGTDKDLMDMAGLRRAAAVYHAAFGINRPGFPYFTARMDGGRG